MLGEDWGYTCRCVQRPEVDLTSAVITQNSSTLFYEIRSLPRDLELKDNARQTPVILLSLSPTLKPLFTRGVGVFVLSQCVLLPAIS